MSRNLADEYNRVVARDAANEIAALQARVAKLELALEAIVASSCHRIDCEGCDACQSSHVARVALEKP